MRFLLSLLTLFSTLAFGQVRNNLPAHPVMATVPLKLYSIKVDVNASGNAIAEYWVKGDWVLSVAWIGEGDYNITMKQGIFDEQPHCVGSAGANHVAGGTYLLYRQDGSNSTVIKVQTINAAATNADEDFVLICVGN